MKYFNRHWNTTRWRLSGLLFILSFTDNFGSPIFVSYWLIFCCGNLIFHQKKKWKLRQKFYDKKQQQKCQTSTWKQIISIEPWYKMFQTLQRRKKCNCQWNRKFGSKRRFIERESIWTFYIIMNAINYFSLRIFVNSWISYCIPELT